MSTEPARPAEKAELTPSQTIGPFFAYALTPRAYGGDELATGRVAPDGMVGERIVVEGTITDGDGALVDDAMIELWQADPQGRYGAAENTGFNGFGRSETTEGRFRFETVMPGAVVEPDGSRQAPHLSLSIFARGLLIRLITRIYFEGEPANEQDRVLGLVPEERRGTLMAKRGEHGVWRFDIRLQGEDETVFFDA